MPRLTSSAVDPAPNGAAPDEALLLDARAVAALLSVSPKTVQRLAAAGSLRAIKVGRLTRWDRRDVLAWIDAHRKEIGGVDKEANGRR